jgi:hypothetical protein
VLPTDLFINLAIGVQLVLRVVGFLLVTGSDVVVPTVLLLLLLVVRIRFLPLGAVLR